MPPSPTGASPSSGAANIEAELGRWYADPGRFEEIRRTALPDGELVEFVLTWEEDGEPHMAHQAHLIEVHDGLITRDRAWCGGRWGAALQAEMAEAARSVTSSHRADATIPIAESLDRLLQGASSAKPGRRPTRSRAAASSGWSSTGSHSS